MSNQLLVRYEPNSIPWRTPNHHGNQHVPQAHVVLTVRAVDEATLQCVDAMVTSYNPASLNDPNNLDFHTNIPQTLVLSQVTSQEGTQGSDIYSYPEVQVNAPGYDVFLLILA